MKQDSDKVMDQKNRTKIFDFFDKDPISEIEGTGEYPIMYRALGSEPRTQHPFHLYDDIKSESVAIKKTLEIIKESVKRVADEIFKRKISHIIGIGLGTSQFIIQAAGPAFWEWADITSEDRDSVEAAQYDKPYDYKHTAVFAYSGSGSTVDTIRATKILMEKGVYSVAFTSIAGSPITKETTDTIACAGGFDTGGSDTFHYATRLAASLALAVELGKRTGKSSINFADLESELNSVAEHIEKRWDATDKRCRNIAKQFKDIRAALIIGAGPSFGIAEEMELKFEEMAHIPSKSMVPTRHLHGAFGLTTEKILTIIISPPNNKEEKWLTQIANVTMVLKSPAIAIVADGEKTISVDCNMDYVIRTPVLNEHIFGLYCVPWIQLFPYYCAVEQGNINPDCQRSNIPKHARAWKLEFPRGSH